MKLVSRCRVTLLVVAFCMGTAALAAAQEESPSAEMTAGQIIERAAQRNALGFESGRAQIVLEVFDRAGERRERNLEVRSKRIDGQMRTLLSLTDPPQVRGQAFLFAENEDGADDMWMFVPAFDVSRRVEGSQRRSSFLGSHFTFADLESRGLQESTYQRKDDETIGADEVYVIEARPNQPEDSDYSRVRAYIRQSDFLTLRVRFYDKYNKIAKTLQSERISTTEDDIAYIEELTLRAEDGGQTTIRISTLDTGVELPDSVFSREQLGR